MFIIREENKNLPSNDKTCLAYWPKDSFLESF